MSHYLNQCWPDSLTHICSTRGRWVKAVLYEILYYIGLRYNDIRLYSLRLGGQANSLMFNCFKLMMKWQFKNTGKKAKIAMIQLLSYQIIFLYVHDQFSKRSTITIFLHNYKGDSSWDTNNNCTHYHTSVSSPWLPELIALLVLERLAVLRRLIKPWPMSESENYRKKTYMWWC